MAETVRIIAVEGCLKCPYRVMLGGPPVVRACWNTHKTMDNPISDNSTPEWCPLQKVEVRDA